jgi:hypothetical protein
MCEYHCKIIAFSRAEEKTINRMVTIKHSVKKYTQCKTIQVVFGFIFVKELQKTLSLKQTKHSFL